MANIGLTVCQPLLLLLLFFPCSFCYPPSVKTDQRSDDLEK